MLAIMVEEGWRPEIGDPTLMGWVTVAAYFAVGLLCVELGRQAKRRANVSETFFWGACAVFLLVLGINKQLDLQSLLTVTGKRMALSQGWYEYRGIVQTFFIAFVALGGAVLLTFWFWLVWGAIRRHWLALCGGVFLFCFVVIRAASFHHVDQLIGFSFAGVKLNWIFELGGIACIAVSGLLQLWTADATGRSRGTVANRST